jgi:nicotinate-nucleotide pyrophosphorylase
MSELQQASNSNSQNDEINIVKTISTKLSKVNDNINTNVSDAGLSGSRSIEPAINDKKQILKNVTEIMVGYLKIDDVIKQKQEQINQLMFDNFKLNAEKSRLENLLVEFLIKENGDFIQTGDGSRLTINTENVNDIVIKSLRREKHNAENK